jgi:hypothetical protein
LILIALLRRHFIPDPLQAPVTLGFVVSLYTLVNHLAHESGLVAVTLMGFILANQKKVAIRHITTFKEHLTLLLIACLFVVLAARLEPSALLHYLYPNGILYLAGLILVARPVGVLLSTIHSGLSWREKLFLAWVFPRGIVAAAVAPLFAHRLENLYDQAGELIPIVYLVIFGTVGFYGVTAPFMARLLKVTQPNPQGLLIVGAHPLARALGKLLQESGVDVLLADTNHRNVRKARLEGLRASFSNVLSEEGLDELDLGGIGHLLALTPNDEVNSLAAVHGSEVFGRARVFQLAAGTQEGPALADTAAHLRGRTAFGPEITFLRLMELHSSGYVVKKTTLSEDFNYQAFQDLYGNSAVILLRIHPDQTVQVVAADKHIEPLAGTTLLSLVQPKEDNGESVDTTKEN